MQRNYELAEKVSRLGDDAYVGVNEVAAFTNFAPISIQQRKIKGFPAPISGSRKLRWRLGDIRAWGK